MKTSIEERLQHYLDRIAAGETVDGLLPEIEAEAEGAELARLVSLSASAIEILPQPMSAPRRGRMQAELQDAFAAAHSQKGAKRAGFFASWLRPLPRLAALALSLILLATTGVVVQAEGSVPGDTLYGVKRVTENARMALTADPLRRARLQLSLADRRLDELQRLADRGAAIDAGLIDELLEQHEAILEQTRRLDDPVLVETVRGVMQKHLALIVDLSSELEDPGDQERVEQVEARLRGIEEKLPTAVAAPMDDAPNVAIPTEPSRNDPAQGTRKARVTPSPRSARATTIRVLPTQSPVPAVPTEGAGPIAPQPGPSVVPPGSTPLPPSEEPPGIVMTAVPGTPVVRPTRPVRQTAEAARRATEQARIRRATQRAERREKATQQAKRRATEDARRRMAAEATRRANRRATEAARPRPTRSDVRPTRTPRPNDRTPEPPPGPSPTDEPPPSATP